MKTQSLNIEWQKFKKTVYDKGMDPEQEKQVHRAFFAGALTVFNYFNELGDLPEDDAEKCIRVYEGELHTFLHEMRLTIQGRD